MGRGKRKSSTPLEDTQSDDEGQAAGGMCFSQQPAEASQDILPAKVSEQRNLDNLPDEEREKIVMDLSRLILFKALAGETIDRKAVCKEAGITNNHGRIQSAAFSNASDRLKNVFGFQLRRLPKWLEKQKSTPKKYNERHYLVVGDMGVGTQVGHCKAMYSVHTEKSVEKGLLMVVLSFVFCKGEQRSDGSRWLLDLDLYRLLNVLDENIPAEPPTPGAKKGPGRFQADDGQGPPNVDALLEQFVKLDYLIKEKITEDLLSSKPELDENAFLYALGPRGALEIGRRQIVCFCAEILDEEANQEMLDEFEREEREDEEEMEE